MQTLKISPSRLEQIRRYNAELLTLEELINQIKGTSIPNEYMKEGSTFGNILNGRLLPDVDIGDDYVHAAGFCFDKNMVAEIATYINSHAPVLYEYEINHDVMFQGQPLRWHCFYDVYTPYDKIIEIKRSQSVKDMMYYLSSMQWKCYLWLAQEYNLTDYLEYIISYGDHWLKFGYSWSPDFIQDIEAYTEYYLNFIEVFNLKKYVLIEEEKKPITENVQAQITENVHTQPNT